MAQCYRYLPEILGEACRKPSLPRRCLRPFAGAGRSVLSQPDVTRGSSELSPRTMAILAN